MVFNVHSYKYGKQILFYLTNGFLYIHVPRYNSKLREARVTNTLKGLAVGVNFGVIYFLIFVCYAIAFW